MQCRSRSASTAASESGPTQSTSVAPATMLDVPLAASATRPRLWVALPRSSQVFKPCASRLTHGSLTAADEASNLFTGSSTVNDQYNCLKFMYVYNRAVHCMHSQEAGV